MPWMIEFLRGQGHWQFEYWQFGFSSAIAYMADPGGCNLGVLPQNATRPSGALQMKGHVLEFLPRTLSLEWVLWLQLWLTSLPEAGNCWQQACSCSRLLSLWSGTYFLRERERGLYFALFLVAGVFLIEAYPVKAAFFLLHITTNMRAKLCAAHLWKCIPSFCHSSLKM